MTAYDGRMTIDFMSINVDFIEKDSDNSSILVIAGGIASFLVMALRAAEY